MKASFIEKPVARIIKRTEGIVGEITGAKEALHTICQEINLSEAMFDCRFTVEHAPTAPGSKQATIRIMATPRKGSLLGKNPEEALLRTLFSDDRPPLVGRRLHFDDRPHQQ